MNDDIKATKEMVHFIIELIKAIEKSIADGLSVMDAIKFIAPAIAATEAFKDLKEIPEELKNLDATKAQEICDLISNDFDKSDTTDQIIVKALEVAIKLFDLYLYVKKV